MDTTADAKISDTDMKAEKQEKPEEPQKLEGLLKGDIKTVEEDKKLQEQVVSHTPFGELQDFDADHEFNKEFDSFMNKTMKQMMADSEDWLAQFNAMNNLRVMSKFKSAVLMENLEYFVPFIKGSVDNLRSNISKNSLMFCTEFFSNKESLQTEKYQESLISFLDNVLPSVFLRTVYDKVFIAKEAKTAVSNCLKHCIIPQALDITIKDGCHNKISNKKLQEEAHVSFLKTIIDGADFSKKEHQFLVDGNEKSQMLINVLYIGHESSPRIKKGSIEIFKALDAKLKKGDESLLSVEKLLKITLKKEKVEEEKAGEGAAGEPPVDYDEAKVSTIMKLFKTTSKAAGGPKKDFRSFLKQQKTQPTKTDAEVDVLAAPPKKEE